MTVWDYKVHFGYGAKDGYWYGPNGKVGPYHRGEDRGGKTGTPITVNGVKIGEVGSTGYSSGPHLHLGKWKNGKDYNPNGRGAVLAGARVHSTGYDRANGNFVRVEAEGYLWVYLHMSKITCKAGQILKGDDMADANDVKAIYQYGPLGRKADSAGIKHYTGKDTDFILKDHYNSKEARDKRGREARAEAVQVKQIKDLNKSVADLKKALANEKNKKPETVVKEVEKIVEKVVEVEVDRTNEVVLDTNKRVRSLWGLIMNIFKRLKK